MNNDIDIVISAPGFDTVRKIEVIPVAPWHRQHIPSAIAILQSKLEAGLEEKGRYICSNCNNILIPERGESGKRRWCFRHLPGVDCPNSQKTYRGESIQHLTSKMLIYNFIKRGGILTARCKCNCGTLISTHEIKLCPGQKIKIEHGIKDSNCRADIGIFDDTSDIFLIEVYHTHKTVSLRKEPWFEFDTSEILSYEEEFTKLDYIQLTDIKQHICETCEENNRQAQNLVATIAKRKCKEKEQRGRLILEEKQKKQTEQQERERLILEENRLKLALNNAIITGNCKLLNTMITNGVDVNMEMDDTSLLDIALNTNNMEIIQILVNNNVNYYSKENLIFCAAFRSNNFLLCDAIIKDKELDRDNLLVLFKWFIQLPMDEISYITKFNYLIKLGLNIENLLQLTISSNNCCLILHLLKLGVDYSHHKDNLFIHAYSYNNKPLQQYMREMKIIPNFHDKSLILYAVINNNHEMLDELIKIGSNISVKDGDGLSLMEHAKSHCYTNIILILMRNGIPIGYPNIIIQLSTLDIWSDILPSVIQHIDTTQLNKLLELSVETSNIKILLLLSIHVTNYIHPDGRTPLIYAVLNNNKNVVKFLLDTGVDILYTIKYKGKKYNAMQIARIHCKNTEILDLIYTKYIQMNH